MNAFDSVRIALKALSRNKLRTCLTMLGMIIGVAAVMTMVALGSGAQASVQDEMKSAGTNLVYVSAGNYTRGGDDIKVASGLGAAKTLVPADADAIGRQITGIKYLSPGVGDRAPMSAGARRYFNRVVGANQDFGAMHSWSVRRGGAMFTRSDVEANARVAVVGTKASSELFGPDVDPVGKTFTIRNETFTVAGLTETEIEDQPESVFVPFTTLQQMRDVTSLDTITVAAIEAGDASRIAAEIGSVLRIRHHIGDGRGAAIAGVPDDFLVKTEAAKALTKGLYTSAAVFVLANLPQLDQITMEEMAGTLQQTSRTLTALLASIAGISLLVGGIGIMNIMLVSVTERTREIGLRMAVGARGNDVLVQFLVEAVTLSIVGGIVGIALGFAASAVVTRMLEWQTVVSAAAIAMAFGTALATGVFFGFYPARRASQLDPIDALRYE
jgi:ABC-type antimicrobial peptide transport system permease subunit